MAEHVIELTKAAAGAPAAATPAAPSPAAPQPAAAPVPAAAAQPAGKGPWNNWLQPPVYKPVAGKPADWDPSRPPTDEAPHGFLRSGDPWSPYGTTKKGKIRGKAVPEMEKRDAFAQVIDGKGTERRLAASDLKPPANVVGLYARIDEDYARLEQDMRELKSRHPETKYNTPPHPKEMGAGALQRTDPHFGPGTIGDVLTGTTGLLARKLKDPDAKPSPETIKEASQKISDASRYYGVNTDPKTTATAAAIIALLFVFAPAIISALGKLVDKVRGV
ncbi:MAG: hypothetical protein M0R37_12550 [Bacteroidales bacterium]|nr:hypothetical protein [Bacteroidales bacterium]